MYILDTGSGYFYYDQKHQVLSYNKNYTSIQTNIIDFDKELKRITIIITLKLYTLIEINAKVRLDLLR